MASFSRVRAPAWAFAAARPPSEAPSLSAITGLPAARAALRVYFTRPGGRKLAHYGEREVTRLFAARSAPIALPSQPERPTPTRCRGSRHCVRSPVASSVGTDQLLGGPLLAPGRGRCARRANAGQGRAASPRPTRGQGSQLCPCARVTAFTFSLKRSTAYGANGSRTLPHVDHELGAGPCRTSSGLRGTQPIRLEQKFEFLVRRANRRIQWIGQRAARNAENECSR
jgi:hypothetical protein